MATEPAADLNDLIARISAADQQIDQACGQIYATIATFKELFAQGPWDEEADLPDVDADLATFGDAIRRAGEGAANEFEAIVQAGREVVDHHETVYREQFASWQAIHAQVTEACEAFETALKTSRDTLETDFNSLEAGLSNAMSELDSARGSVDQVYADWEQATTGELAERLQTRFEAMIEQIAQTETDKIGSVIDELQSGTDNAVQEWLANAGDQVQQLSQALSEVLVQLQHHVGDEVEQKLQDAARTLIESAVREILQSLTEALATSELGVEITSAMSPILPELIAIKKVTDLILEAIRIWKDTIGGLTDLFS